MTDSASQSLVERLPELPDDHSDLTPELALMVVGKYRELMSQQAARITELEAERDRLQHALQFWMPGVDARLDDATQERAANDAYLLVDYRGQLDGPCWGDAVLDDLARVRDELDASNNNHRSMAHQMAELGARCKHAESELSRVEVETIERCALTGAIQCDVHGFPKLGTYVADAIRSLPPLAKRGDQESPSKQTQRERE